MAANTVHRVVCYYQTFCGLASLLALPDPLPVTHVVVAAVHFGTNKDGSPYIHLNDEDPDSKTFDPVWAELAELRKRGVTVTVMVGGAGGAYGVLFSDFATYYPLLRDFLEAKQDVLQGVDLDVEETVTLPDLKMLIRRLDSDFGVEFYLTMAPMAGSLTSDGSGMGGFSYKELVSSPEGMRIDWFHGQFYGDFDAETYDACVANGYPARQVVMGMLSGEYSDDKSFAQALAQVHQLAEKHGPDFGGCFVWEFSDSPPSHGKDPAAWAQAVSKALTTDSRTRKATDARCTSSSSPSFCAIL